MFALVSSVCIDLCLNAVCDTNTISFYTQPIPEDNPDDAMKDLEISDKMKLAKSTLYHDHTKDRLSSMI